MSDEPTATPEEPAPTTITVSFNAEMGMLLSAPGATIGHMWAAASLIQRVADQMWEDHRNMQVAKAVQEKQAISAVRSALMTPIGRRS